jgi:hypothetical protein
MNKVCLQEEVFEKLLNLALKNCETNQLHKSSNIKIKPRSFISIGSNSVPTTPDCEKSPFGCCDYSCIARVDNEGSNCIKTCIPRDLPIHPGGTTYTPFVNCSTSEYGCCAMSCRAREDNSGSNCEKQRNRPLRCRP